MYQESGPTLSYAVPGFKGTVYGVRMQESSDGPATGAYPVGAGTPEGRRVIELLWDPPGPGRRGPRQKISLAQVVDGALAVADADGFEALSMRGLAKHLGVGAMSLYTYVPGKAELLDLMLDTVFGQLPLADYAGKPWRARVESVAAENRAMFLAHPWVAAVSTIRPPLGPGLIAKYEHELGAFDGVGLDDLELDAALTYLLSFVQSAVSAAFEAERSQLDTAQTDAEWWERFSPLLERVYDATKYPLASRVGSAAGEAYQSAFSPERAYEFGLQRVLDGLGVLIDSRAGGDRLR
jgi:AcrR family transcriptional regulator